MKIKVVSREMIRPSSATVLNEAPHKLCLIDHITPLTYMSSVLFYPNFSISDPETLPRLKTSLSQTLNSYYPFSGRIRNNVSVEDFDTGVLFQEADINITMSEYFELKDIESLNRLVPFEPLRRESGSVDFPLLAFQANVFSCGAMALGTSFCHKAGDGATTSCFLSSWAALFRGDPTAVTTPNLDTAMTLFPLVEDFTPQIRSEVEEVWFQQGARYVATRFVFDAQSTVALVEKAKREGTPPTRNEAVTCFLWERITEASREVSGDRTRISASMHAVNLRPRITRLRPDYGPWMEGATGNLLWLALALSFDPCDENASKEVVELAACTTQLRRTMAAFDDEFLGAVMLEGKDGSSEVMSQLRDLMAMGTELPDALMFTNWKNFYNDIDFGWGKPFWIGPAGKSGSLLREYVTMIESAQFSRGIEAFIFIEDAKMAVLKRDEKFLEFASLNPDFSTPV